MTAAVLEARSGGYRSVARPDLRRPPLLVAGLIAALPFLVGIPRGVPVPLLRPSEVLQLLVTSAVLVPMVVEAIANGTSRRITLRPSEWWLAATVVSASVVPLLWLVARDRPVGAEELLAAAPFVKYAALFLLVRLAVRTVTDARVVMLAVVASATVIAAVGVAQVLGFGPLIELLGEFYVSGADDVVDGGRATTTIGSSIATGAYLASACGIALSWAFTTDRPGWYGVAAALAVGALASGQAGSVVAIVATVVVVSVQHGRVRQLAVGGTTIGLVGTVVLWPVVAARLSAVDRGTGLPESWVVRWVNVTELYWPSLVNGGWLLGVNPDATQAPPDVWREIVYLESGYLWLLWVGGLPLLVATIGFLVTSYRELGTEADHRLITALRRAGRASLATMAVLMVFDPHLTLRAGAHLFFVLMALGAATMPDSAPLVASHRRWSGLFGANRVFLGQSRLRLQVAERPTAASAPWPGTSAEPGLTITVTDRGREVGRAELELGRRRGELHGRLNEAVDGRDARCVALAWRAVVLCSDSLRLRSLALTTRSEDRVERREIAQAAGLARRLERQRQSDPAKSDPRPSSPAGGTLPAVRLERPRPVPRWKRAADLALGGLLLIVTAPLWLGCAFAVRRSSPGPVLFRQLRVGGGGLPFQLYKFRTMYLDNDDRAVREQNRRELLDEAEAVKDEADRRITPTGRWLRRLSLDELPQLLNILGGQMSLVGPRPSLLWEVELFEPSRRRRLRARPGLTGLWQVSGRGDVSMSEMLELDLTYVDTMSPAVDMRCLAATARSVASGRGAR